MPDRIVRVGILTSDAVNKLSWPAEVFYRRLFSVVDDYGRYDGRPTLLRAHLYPLKIDRVSDADVGKWLTECVTAGLVSVYQVSGQQYLEVFKFGQRVRADKSKWPSPPASADICQQSLSDAPVFVSVVADVVVTPKAPKGADGRFEIFWAAYPAKVGKDAARKAFAKRDVDEVLLGQMLSAIEGQKASEKWAKDKGRYIPNPATWLNQGRWQDEAPAVAAASSLTVPSNGAEHTQELLRRQAEHDKASVPPPAEVLERLNRLKRGAGAQA